jgi:microcystin-dependent protein
MGLETAEYISGLVTNWPLSTDKRREGDDHLRLLKQVLKNTFPNLNAEVTATPSQLNNLPENLTALAAEMVKHLVPKRAIMAFSGLESDVPTGWAVCDGRTVQGFGTTPDLRGRFIIGVSPTYGKDQTGGAASVNSGTSGSHSHVNQGVALTLQQIPNHSHKVKYTGSNASSGGTDMDFIRPWSDAGTLSVESESVGGGQTHTHGMDAAGEHLHTVATLPPFYALFYIIKTTDYVAPV